jgi:hypothetical protein
MQNGGAENGMLYVNYASEVIQCVPQFRIEQIFAYSGIFHVSNSAVLWMKYVS